MPRALRAQGLLALLLALILGLILGLSLIASGLRIGAGVAIEGAALRDCIGGPQAHTRDAPGQPPPRLLDAELRKDSEDDGDDFLAPADIIGELPQPRGTISSYVSFVAQRSEAAQRARQCQGARGPPNA
jgi:hypothetical protein